MRPNDPDDMLYLLAGCQTMGGLPGWYGAMANPGSAGVRRPIKEGRQWGVDNGCFTGKYLHERYVDYLEKHLPWRSTCLFATVPDVVGDAKETRERWDHYHPILSEIGLPMAFVAQDGCVASDVPAEAQCLFVGGTDDFKLTDRAVRVIEHAKERGLWVHIGRVNSQKRIRWCRSVGADSVDGTHERFAGRDATVRQFDVALQEGWLF